MEQRFWLLDQKANKSYEIVSTDDAQRTVEVFFGSKVVETGPAKFDFASQGYDGGFRYWNCQVS